MPRSGSHHQQPQPSIFDFSFERDSFSSVSSSINSAVGLTDHNPSVWSDSYQVACVTPESLDQFNSGLDLDFLLDPTSLAEQQGDLSFDLPLDFDSHDQTSFDFDSATTTQDQVRAGLVSNHTTYPSIDLVEGLTSPSCSSASMSEGGKVLSQSAPYVDLVDVGMDPLYFTNMATTSSTTKPTTSSPISMTSLPSSRGYHHQQQQQPLLAPKQHTPPSSSSSSCSPALSHVHTVDLESSTNMMSKKRSRAESDGIDSSNNSAQDSEEERVLEKRRRNTMAARRFRQRKQDHVSDLKSQLDKVSKERDDLRLKVAKWEGEVMALRKLLEMKK